MIRRLLVGALPAWTLSAVCCVAILYLTLWPDPLRGVRVGLFPGADKVVHGIMMMGMMLCLGLDTLRKKAASPMKGAACAPDRLLFVYFVAVALFGGGIELLQDAMHLGRSKDWTDAVADAAGAGVGWALCRSQWAATWRWVVRRRE